MRDTKWERDATNPENFYAEWWSFAEAFAGGWADEIELNDMTYVVVDAEWLSFDLGLRLIDVESNTHDAAYSRR